MVEPIRFVSQATVGSRARLNVFVDFVKKNYKPLLDSNNFDGGAWSVEGLVGRVQNRSFVYFSQLGISPNDHQGGTQVSGVPAKIPEELLLREPFLSFAKSLLAYMHCWKKTVCLGGRVIAFRYLEASLYELNGTTCPTATTPEVLNRACRLAADMVSISTSYNIGKQLEIIYRYMVGLELVAFPSDWVNPLPHSQSDRIRVGKQFDEERKKKLPSPLVLESLASIFNSNNNDPREIFTTSVCALLLCSPDRSVEVLQAPLDVIAPDWTDPETGEVGTALRWFPAKGGRPMTKTVIPSMREIAIRAVDRLRQLGAPARELARWYEQNPNRMFLPPHLEYLREREQLHLNEVFAILFGGKVCKVTKDERVSVRSWLIVRAVPLQKKGVLTVTYKDLEQAVLAELPKGFPVMDPVTGVRYSEALCVVRAGEFDIRKKSPTQCCFNRVKYIQLYSFLKSKGNAQSIFERRGLRDENGDFLFLTSHMLRHYLNTLIRQSGKLTEEEIAQWSGRKSINQNATYNHQSDRDVISKLRGAVGDPSKSIGPFANIDNRIFLRRDEFASVKIITAHTTEFGYCVHDYAQSPCQMHQDCMHCDEQVCIKGDVRAEENLRKTRVELLKLQEDAYAAFTEDVLGAAEWFAYQRKTLERVDQLIAILDNPEVPSGAVIQLSGVVPPSRLVMAEKTRNLQIKPISNTIKSIDDVHGLLNDDG